MSEESGLVELVYCIGAACLQEHGVRLATRRGVGPCSIYIVCDECFAERLTDAERVHMIEVCGADRIRELGLHELHHGRLPWGQDLVMQRQEGLGAMATVEPVRNEPPCSTSCR